jgi:hypothetical protein
MNNACLANTHPLARAGVLCALASLVTLCFAGCPNVQVATHTRDDCTKAGGLCLPSGECTAGGGSVSTDCYLDTADSAECCMGPPTRSGSGCADQGGLCVPAVDCAEGNGYQTVQGADCGGGQGYSCCVPQARCPGPTPQCCMFGEGQPPLCDMGMFSCAVGTLTTSNDCGPS